MSYFELNRRIPSCYVDKALVQALEDHLRQETARRRAVGAEHDDAGWVSIDITHDTGRQTFRSMSEHVHQSFVDGTHEIAIACHAPGGLDVRLQFSTKRQESFVRVRYPEARSRASALALIAGIERIVAQRRTWDSWVYPHVGLSGLVDGVALGVIVFALYAFSFGSRVPRWTIWASLLLPAYRMIGFFKPYTAFETPEARTLRTVGNLLTAGLAGLVLVTAIGAYFDIEWLGF
jgi:hypothetical protein